MRHDPGHLILGPDAQGARRMRRTRRVAIVGNAPEVGDHAEAIDRADVVVRFNNAHGLGGVTGTRTSYLFLVNAGGQMREWLDDPRFAERPAVRSASAVFLPIHPDHLDHMDRLPSPEERRGADAEDHTAEAVAKLTRAGVRVELLSAPSFAAAMRELGRAAVPGAAPPSTGYLGTRHFVETLGRAGCRIECYGFGWDGYAAHDWDGERAWFDAREREGRLHVVPLDALPVPGRSVAA